MGLKKNLLGGGIGSVAELIPAAAATGPLAPFAIAGILAANFGMAIFSSLMGRGHADDDVDSKEDELAVEFFSPIVTVLNPSVSILQKKIRKRTGLPFFRWSDIDAAADSAQLQLSDVTRLQAQEWIRTGDSGIEDLCQAFAEQGWPCQPEPPGRKSSGAGRNIRPTWEKIRARLVEVRDGAVTANTPIIPFGVATQFLEVPVAAANRAAVSVGLPRRFGEFTVYTVALAAVVGVGVAIAKRKGKS